jgi:hypothetical protein
LVLLESLDHPEVLENLFGKIKRINDSAEDKDNAVIGSAKTSQ